MVDLKNTQTNSWSQRLAHLRQSSQITCRARSDR